MHLPHFSPHVICGNNAPDNHSRILITNQNSIPVCHLRHAIYHKIGVEHFTDHTSPLPGKDWPHYKSL